MSEFGNRSRGPMGFRGPRGNRGATGPTGPTGPIGPIGPMGELEGEDEFKNTFSNPTIEVSDCAEFWTIPDLSKQRDLAQGGANEFINIATSATGKYLLATVNSVDFLYYSDNYGDNLIELNPQTEYTDVYYSACAISGDGQVMVIATDYCADFGLIISVDYGKTWTINYDVVANTFTWSIGISFDGKYITYAPQSGTEQDEAGPTSAYNALSIMSSSDYGKSWIAVGPTPTLDLVWMGAGMSQDGLVQLVPTSCVTYSNGSDGSSTLSTAPNAIYTTDGWVSWEYTSVVNNYTGCGVSASGNILALAAVEAKAILQDTGNEFCGQNSITISNNKGKNWDYYVWDSGYPGYGPIGISATGQNILLGGQNNGVYISRQFGAFDSFELKRMQNVNEGINLLQCVAMSSSGQICYAAGTGNDGRRILRSTGNTILKGPGASNQSYIGPTGGTLDGPIGLTIPNSMNSYLIGSSSTPVLNKSLFIYPPDDPLLGQVIFIQNVTGLENTISMPTEYLETKPKNAESNIFVYSGNTELGKDGWLKFALD